MGQNFPALASVLAAVEGPTGRPEENRAVVRVQRVAEDDVVAVALRQPVAQLAPGCAAVVTAAADKTARVWDPVTGGTIAVLSGHEDRLTAARFTPAGDRIWSRAL